MHEFDLSLYFPLPNLTTEGYVTLAKVLLNAAPENPPPHLAATMASLEVSLAEAETALVARIDEDLGTQRDRNFDLFVDAVWYAMRERLASWSLYAHDGAAELSEADRDALELDERLERARLAAQVHAKLFGDGVDFLRMPYAQQAAHMAARLRWFASKDHAYPLAELIGPDLASLVARCQVRYEAMVSERNTKTGRSIADLREIRNVLRRQLYRYCGALGTLVEDDDAASVAAVEAALRPILMTRARSRSRQAGAGLEGEQATLGEEAAEPEPDGSELGETLDG